MPQIDAFLAAIAASDKGEQRSRIIAGRAAQADQKTYKQIMKELR